MYCMTNRIICQSKFANVAIKNYHDDDNNDCRPIVVLLVVVPRERFELPTPAFVAQYSDPDELTRHNYNMHFYITKPTTLILSSPRTGSTMLGEYVKTCSVYPGARYFIEPSYTGKLEEFQKYFAISKLFVLKAHYSHLDQYGTDIVEYLLKHAFLIRIRRRDIVKQIASFYIAQARQFKWHFTQPEELAMNDIVPIKHNNLASTVEEIFEFNNAIDSSTIKFDLDLYYEDLPKIQNTKYFLTPQPQNYQELLAEVEKLVKQKAQ